MEFRGGGRVIVGPWHRKRDNWGNLLTTTNALKLRNIILQLKMDTRKTFQFRFVSFIFPCTLLPTPVRIADAKMTTSLGKSFKSVAKGRRRLIDMSKTAEDHSSNRSHPTRNEKRARKET